MMIKFESDISEKLANSNRYVFQFPFIIYLVSKTSNPNGNLLEVTSTCPPGDKWWKKKKRSGCGIKEKKHKRRG
jgi:hypothetical protein